MNNKTSADFLLHRGPQNPKQFFDLEGTNGSAIGISFFHFKGLERPITRGKRNKTFEKDSHDHMYATTIVTFIHKIASKMILTSTNTHDLKQLVFCFS